MPRRPDKDHDVEHEPHLSSTPAEPDPSEQKTRPRTHERCDSCGYSRDRLDHDTPCPECGAIPEELARHSVYNEPGAIFPPGSPAFRTGQAVRDWSCDHCGYNVRGIPLGSKCPECGQTSLSRPAPLEHASYAAWLKHRLDQPATPGDRLLLVGLVALAGLLAIIGSLVEQIVAVTGQIITICVWAPLVEELMKITAIAMIAERWPYRFRSANTILWTAIAAALLFAAVENTIYLTVFNTAPSNLLIASRWIGCTALHVGTTYIAAIGVMRMWTQATTEYREPDAGHVYRSLGLAIVLHGIFNAALLALRWSGAAF